MLFPSSPVTNRRLGTNRRLADVAGKLCDESAARFYPCRARDVSASGCRLVVPPNFAATPGTVLFLHLADNDTPVARRSQMRPVRVAWRMALDDHGGFAIGVERMDVADHGFSVGTLAATSRAA